MLGVCCLHRAHDGVGSHHHPGASAVRIVVRLVVLVEGKVADVDHVDLEPALFCGAPQDAEPEDVEIFREYGEEMELHEL